jgi:hypothetical protein
VGQSCFATINNCATYTSLGQCQTCQASYILTNSSCISLNILYPNCLSFTNNICQTCKNGYYLNTSSNCIQVSSFCTTYIMNTGACTGCVAGYSVLNGVCTSAQAIHSNPFCNTFSGTTCIYCNLRYYLGVNAYCTNVNVMCANYSMTTGSCTSCNPGYVLSTPLNSNVATCASQSAGNQFCTAFTGTTCTYCSTRYYVGVNSMCTAVNQACKTYDMVTGACLSCFDGRTLPNGVCF